LSCCDFVRLGEKQSEKGMKSEYNVAKCRIA
jgi:hypothetical protein